MNKGIGITERGDAGLDFSWRDKVGKYAFSILITKSLNDEFIDSVKGLDNVIVHATITGYGGTVVEPNVPLVLWSVAQLQKLFDIGFPVERIVGRVDPIFPTIKGKALAESVVRRFAEFGIKRIRYSYVDMYKHVRERFEAAGIQIPSFTEKHLMADIMPMFPGVRFESCAEGLDTDVGCLSVYDFALFGLEPDVDNINGQNRKNCKCLACKVELLDYKNNKRCPHQCLYCYWRDN